MAFSTLEDLKKAIKDAVTDIASLDVTTLTGTMDFQIDGQTVKLEPGSIFAHLQATASAKLSVLAHTHKDFDADTLLFVKENLSEAQGTLLEAHRDAVEAAMEQRRAAIEVLKSFL